VGRSLVQDKDNALLIDRPEPRGMRVETMPKTGSVGVIEEEWEDLAPETEFDRYADTYLKVHAENIKVTGEPPAYFAEYKIADLAQYLSKAQTTPRHITDFGSGIGNSIPFFREYFPAADLTCVDESTRSIDVAQSRFPGDETFVLVRSGRIPIEDASQDVVFSANVFHHIDHDQHQVWLKELLRIVKPGGLLAIYEHNPLNPLTVRAVDTCPFDQNAELIASWKFRRACSQAGWSRARTDYRLFFPHALSGLRWMEPKLGWLCLGAQYRLLATRV
jgi:SAM-dependent methyltransferase